MEEFNNNNNNMSYKKLTRSRTDKKIAGVCGGVAQYMECDPTVVRIIFLIALLCGSLGFWAYLIIWLVAPEE
jgi:phage shock protein PspC (stress-responsive transcriptional regulator)